ncbi:hypothetical protein QQS21_002787 [Conoideocrella luteorostrata]|uniref:Uncharacterized protein n=1 Tax=Conoideocrella luteorostrata TaxID=1105319 RepID=A0AAJ0G2Q6_9HYPO|nr:hypothetical protein QQS21_002787 [Conoideocrella luteorostrata]
MARPVSLNRRYTASSADDAAPSFSPLSSNPFVLHRRTHTGVEEPQRVERSGGRPQSALPHQRVRNNLYAGDLHDTMPLAERILAYRSRDDVTALVDFLKNQPPPSYNFMSIPDDCGDDNRGRWSKIKTIARRSKSMPRERQHIRLPDSAVAGMTIGGHRHIAISIPLEATPYANDMRSQYPVTTHNIQMGIPSKESVRTYRNEKGVVTVLRPVTELREADARSVASKRRSPPYANSQGLKPPPVPPYKPTGNAGSRPHDYIGYLPTKFDTPSLDDSSAPWHVPQTPSRAEGSTQNNQIPPIFQRATYPARGSSMVANRGNTDPLSIDGVISPQEQVSHIPIVSRPRYFSESFNRERQASTTGNNPVGDESRKGYQKSDSGSQPLEKNDVRPILNRNGSQIRTTTLVADSPLLSQDDDSCPPTPGSTRSRKDIVRAKKRRDMEALWQARMKEQHQRNTGALDTSQPTTTATTQTLSKVTNYPYAAVSKSGSNLTLSNLMVVMDVEPCSTDDTEPAVCPKLSTSEEAAKNRAESPAPLVTVSSPTIPTPPTSPRRTPPQRHSASDRTSLTRRREWKAVREKERKAREAMMVATAKAQQLASGGVTYDNGAVSQADQEVLRLYEAYREHRLRDMERRLHRLERNGDVWLQALVPVLNSMNKTLAGENGQSLEDTRDWASDGEMEGAAEQTSRDVQKKRLTRRSSLTQARLLEKLTGQSYDDDTWSDSISRSDDASGLGTIEPLMRELAGEARLWEGTTTQSPVATTNGQIHVI